MGNHTFKTRTSQVSAKQAINTLIEAGYEVERHDKIAPEPRPTEKKPVAQARAMFGRNVKTSQGGHVVTFKLEDVSVFVPHQGMLGHGALDALRKKTGLKFSN